MRKSILLMVMLAAFQFVSMAQAAKPTIMVYPSDKYCFDKGYFTTVEKNGEMVKVPDVAKCVTEDADMRTAVRAIGNFMQENQFPLTDLEMATKDRNDADMLLSVAQGKNNGSVEEETPMQMLLRSAKPDIMISLDMNLMHVGPRMKLDFSLDAFDTYTSKRIAGLQNPEGSTGTNLAVLVQEGVLATKDAFLAALQSSFDDMFANGKEISVRIAKMDSWDGDFESEFEYNDDDVELADIIRSWFNKNTVQKRFTVKTKHANMLEYTQVRIPVYTTDIDGEQMANDAGEFGKKLAKAIKKVAQVPVGVVPQGLGSVTLFVGEKAK